MITEQDLQEAIAECEGVRNPNANTCIKLAAFYTIRNELFQNQKKEPITGHSFSIAPQIEYESDSDFGRAISGKDPNNMLPVIDELMQTLQLINPKLYNAVMKKLSGI